MESVPCCQSMEVWKSLVRTYCESVVLTPGSPAIDVYDAPSILAERGEALAPATPVPAEIATQAKERPAFGGDVDAVDCTVFAPPTVAAADSILVQLFAHMPQQADEVIQLRATRRDRQASGIQLAGSRDPSRLQAPGRVDPPWPRDRRPGPDFRLAGPCRVGPVRRDGSTLTAPGNLIGKVTIYLQGTPIGHIRFKIQITARRPRMVPSVPPPGEPVTPLHSIMGGTGEKPEPRPLGDEACRYKQAFVSYAMKDLNEVMKRVQMLARLHVSFFQDLLDLEPGERWERKLYKHIDDCDVFMLFWSTASKQSQWVTKEVQYALARKGGDDLSTSRNRPGPDRGTARSVAKPRARTSPFQRQPTLLHEAAPKLTAAGRRNRVCVLNGEMPGPCCSAMEWQADTTSA